MSGYGWTEGATRPLTKREVMVLGCVANGMTNTEISEVLELSTNTVKVHKYNALKKLGLVKLNKGLVKDGIAAYLELYANPAG